MSHDDTDDTLCEETFEPEIEGPMTLLERVAVTLIIVLMLPVTLISAPFHGIAALIRARKHGDET